MGQVLSFIESDLIRGKFMKGNSTAGYKIFTQDQYMNNNCHCLSTVSALLKSKTSYQQETLFTFLKSGNIKAALTWVFIEWM